jgi:hypothetical protein
VTTGTGDARIGVETARRVHAQHDDADLVRRCAVQFAYDIVGDRGTDHAVDIEHQSAFGGPRRPSEHRKHHGQKHGHRAQAHHGNLPRLGSPGGRICTHHILVARVRPARRLRRCDRSSRHADQPRAERNALDSKNCDPAQYQPTAEYIRRLDHGEQRRAQQRILQPP